MKTENLIAKGVKHRFNGQETVFEVESLNEHFDGLQIHKSDIINYIEEDDLVVSYIRASDVNFDNAVAKEVAPKVEEEAPVVGMTYEEAGKLLKIGKLIALPEWGGFWFNDLETTETLVLTKEGDVTNTPFAEFKGRNDWITVKATEEQGKLLDVYFASKQEQLNHIVTYETLADNPELVEAGIEVGETIQVNKEASEEELKLEEAEVLAPEPIAETPAPKKKRVTKTNTNKKG